MIEIFEITHSFFCSKQTEVKANKLNHMDYLKILNMLETS